MSSHKELVFRKILKGLVALLKGMRITGKTLFEKPITLQYPYEKPELRQDYRGLFILGLDICTGCMACARACPSECIFIETHRTQERQKSGAKLAVDRFDINFGLCCQCHLCVEACPVETDNNGKCIYMINEYEQSVYERGGLLLTKEFMFEKWKELAPKMGLLPEEEIGFDRPWRKSPEREAKDQERKEKAPA